MEIFFISDCVDGSTPLDDLKIVCVANDKYKSVDLCLKTKGMNVAFAHIKLYHSNKYIDAERTFEAAEALGNKIADAFKENNMEYGDHYEEEPEFLGVPCRNCKHKNKRCSEEPCSKCEHNVNVEES